MPKEIVIPPVNKHGVELLIGPARGLIVTDSDTLAVANEILVEVKKRLKEIDLNFTPIVKAAHNTHKLLTDQRNKMEAPLKAAKKYLGEQIAIYDTEQERIAAAAKAAEEKRQREEAARIEKERIDAEVKKRVAEELAAKGVGQPPVEALKEPWEAELSPLSDGPSPVPIPTEEATEKTVVHTAPVPKAQNVSFRTDYIFEVESVRALCQAVVDGLAPISFISANMVEIGKAVREQKKGFNCPGITTDEKKTPIVR